MQLDTNNIPQHIAIIMDGNGRWAAERGKPRSFGHQAGVDTVRRITSECTRLGVKYLTLYTFSAENWNNFLAECQKQGQDVTENRTLTAEQRNQIGSTNSNPIVRFFANRQLDAMTQQA